MAFGSFNLTRIPTIIIKLVASGLEKEERRLYSSDERRNVSFTQSRNSSWCGQSFESTLGCANSDTKKSSGPAPNQCYKKHGLDFQDAHSTINLSNTYFPIYEHKRYRYWLHLDYAMKRINEGEFLVIEAGSILSYELQTWKYHHILQLFNSRWTKQRTPISVRVAQICIVTCVENPIDALRLNTINFSWLEPIDIFMGYCNIL